MSQQHKCDEELPDDQAAESKVLETHSMDVLTRYADLSNDLQHMSNANSTIPGDQKRDGFSGIGCE